MKIYNGEGMILGRLASMAAKEALLGEEVVVINCEKIIISGQKSNTVDRERAKRLMKGYPPKSPKYSRLPDRFVRRSIRGMLPWKHARGKEAFSHIMCYRGIPTEFAGHKTVVLSKHSAEKLPNLKKITVGEVCQQLGGKIR